MCAYLHCSWLAFPKACQQGWSEKVLDKEKRRRRRRRRKKEEARKEERETTKEKGEMKKKRGRRPGQSLYQQSRQ